MNEQETPKHLEDSKSKAGGSGDTPDIRNTGPALDWSDTGSNAIFETEISNEKIAAAVGAFGTLGLLAAGDHGLAIRRELFFTGKAVGNSSNEKGTFNHTDPERGAP